MALAQVRLLVPKALEAMPAVLREEIDSAATDSGLLVSGLAKRLAPHATGNLRRSISSHVKPIGGNVAAIVAAAAKYARPVEYGSKPHTPPLAAIARWANRRGLNPGAVWMTIRRQGTKPHPFMVPALEEKQASVIDIFTAGIRRAVERMSAGGS